MASDRRSTNGVARSSQEGSATRKSSVTETTVRALIIAAAISMALAGSPRIASAQSDAAIPIQRNDRGEPSCPANYELRGNACVSIYAGRGVPGSFDRGYGSYRYREDYFEAPRPARPPRRRHRDDYDDGRATVEPRLDYRGELQCPRNFVIRGNLCVSLW
jgi:hypothetical protein